MKRIYSSAIVGCGAISKVHAAVLKSMPDVRVAACADIVKPRAEALAEGLNAKVYDSLDEMLDNEQIDVLHICTPHALHTPMILKTVSRGIAVFSEKPPAVTFDQWEALCALPDSARVGVCFQNRYNPETQAIRGLLDAGTYGKILGSRAFVTWKRDGKYYESSPWRGTWLEAGGGALANQAIHTLDLMVSLLGAPTASETRMENRHLRGMIEVEDTVESFIRFGGATGIFYCTTAYAGDAPVLLEILCERATLRIERSGLDILLDDGTREHRAFSRPEPLGKSYWGNGHVPCIRDFYDRMGDNLPPAIGIPEIDATMRLMLEMYAQNKIIR